MMQEVTEEDFEEDEVLWQSPRCKENVETAVGDGVVDSATTTCACGDKTWENWEKVLKPCVSKREKKMRSAQRL